MTIQSKKCEGACGEIKPLSEFYFRKETGQHRAACKKCKRIKTKEEIIAAAYAETKTCKHCGIEKPRSEFQNAGKLVQPYCKPCDKVRKKKHEVENQEQYDNSRKEYYKNNFVEINKRNRAYAVKNAEKVIERRKAYHARNKESICKRSREYNKKNKSEISKRNKEKREANIEFYLAREKAYRSTSEGKARKAAQDKKYREKNIEVLNAKKKIWYLEKGLEHKKAWERKMKSNVGHVTTKRLRGRIYMALKKGIKSESTIKLLGCSVDYFKSYFESLFTEGMSWDAYMRGEIHIDHIRPCKKFNLTKPSEQRECFNYKNLQPLWRLDNLRKGTKEIYPCAKA